MTACCPLVYATSPRCIYASRLQTRAFKMFCSLNAVVVARPPYHPSLVIGDLVNQLDSNHSKLWGCCNGTACCQVSYMHSPAVLQLSINALHRSSVFLPCRPMPDLSCMSYYAGIFFAISCCSYIGKTPLLVLTSWLFCGLCALWGFFCPFCN